MNERLNIADLVALLVEHTGKDKEFTEQFLRELVVIISDALLEERIVKVKGLGTFKVIQVEERESIHVNTGERFVIPTHSKFTFTPDKDLKEQVNKPFASFETTELNEGVTFPDSPDNKEEEPEDESEEIDDENDVTTEPEKEEEVPVLPEPPMEEEPKPNAEPEKEVESEPEIKPTPEPEEKSELPQESADVKKEEKETVQTKADQQPIVTKTRRRKKSRKSTKRNRVLAVFGILAVICVVGGIYFFIDNPIKPNKITPKIKKQEQVIASEPQPVVEDKTPEVTQPESPVVEEPQVPVVAESQQKEPVIIKIVPDTRLTLIALEHYGHKVFWVYIYEHNKAIIDNPNNIQIGTELIVPDAALYGIDAKNPESIAKAKAKQAEINSKF